jgi:uncharacterized protein YjbI with pentapeptide repeats
LAKTRQKGNKYDISWIKALEVTALLIGIPSASMFLVDIPDKIRNREILAFQTVASVSTGNTGKVSAIEYLVANDWCEPSLLFRVRSLINSITSSEEILRYCLKKSQNLSGLNLEAPKPGVYLERLSLYRLWLDSINLTNSNLSYSKFNYLALSESILSDIRFRELSIQNSVFFRTIFNNPGVKPHSYQTLSVSNSIFVQSCFNYLKADVLTKGDLTIINSSLYRANIAIGGNAYIGLHNTDVTGASFRKSELENSMARLAKLIDPSNSSSVGNVPDDRNQWKDYHLYTSPAGHYHAGVLYGSGLSAALYFKIHKIVRVYSDKKPFYLDTHPPKGIDLSLLDALPKSEYFERLESINIPIDPSKCTTPKH